MDQGTSKEPKLFIDGIDKTTRTNIMRLDQKLRGIRAEMDAKLQGSYDTDQTEQDKEQIFEVIKEIDLAINSIGTVVSLVAGNDEEAINAFLSGPEMQKFGEAMAESLEKITKIKGEL